jgi:hypothetical protein
LEALEDRLTPSGLDFIPVTHVAVNPQPLPPLVQLDFDPVLNLTAASVGTIVQQEQVGGGGSQQNLFPNATTWFTGGSFGESSYYKLRLSVTGTILPPDPISGQEAVSASFSLAGTETVVLIPVAPTTGPAWVYSGTLTETGTFNGVISPADPTTGTQQISGQWAFTMTAVGTSMTPNLPANSWQEMSQTRSQGWELSVAFLDGNPDQPAVTGRVNATFGQQDQVAESLTQVNPFIPPGLQVITINAVFNTSGSMQFQSTPVITPSPGSGLFLGRDDGFMQQLDSSTETIQMPDGFTQIFSQNSQDSGIFIIAILIG